MATHEPQLNNLCILRVKEESAYGADDTPDAGLTALLVSAGAEPEIDGDVIKRNVVQSTFTPRGSIVGAKKLPFKFSIEIHGGLLNAGAPKEPDFAPVLRACGLQQTTVQRLAVNAVTGNFAEGETVTGGTSAATGVFHCLDGGVLVLRNVVGNFASGEAVTGGTSAATANTTALPVKGIEFRPVTSRIAAQKSILAYLYRDHILYLLKGWRGTFDIAAEAGGIPMLNFSGTALWTKPDDVADLPAVTPADIIPPRFERIGAKIGPYDPIFKSFKLNLAGAIQHRDDANSAEGVAEHYLGGREPALSFDPEQDKLANFDPYALWASDAKNDFGFTVGQDAGNRWRLHVPGFQISKPGKGERGTLRTHQIDGVCTGTGDNEFRWTFL